MLTRIPEWLWTSLIGALFAIAGYVGKVFIDKLKQVQQERSKKLSKLLRLRSLLHASKALFVIQQSLAIRLIHLFQKNHTGKHDIESGYEQFFTTNYKLFNEEEKVLHSLIRSYSDKSIKQINEAMSNWLIEDIVFKTGQIRLKEKKVIAEKLTSLETHLLLWHAKYDYWIPNHPEHSLVYLADENEHGLGFPSGLDELIELVIKKF